MLRVFIMALVIIVNFILQSTLFSYIEIIGVKPNSSLMIIVAYSMLRGDIEGSIFGFFCGLLQDIFFGRVLGLFALLGFITGFVCGKPFKDFYRESYIIPLLFACVSCISYEFVFYMIYFFFKGEINFIRYFSNVILPETMYTIIITIPIYRILYSINNFLETHENYDRRLF